MSNILNRNAILRANAETGIDPAFIEKDWYSVQLLEALSAFENDLGVELVFAGGTSLSKGWDLINRFSEDLDFIISPSEHVTVSARPAFRQSILSHIISDPRFTFKEGNINIGYDDRHFQAQIEYNREF